MPGLFYVGGSRREPGPRARPPLLATRPGSRRFGPVSAPGRACCPFRARSRRKGSRAAAPASGCTGRAVSHRSHPLRLPASLKGHAVAVHTRHPCHIPDGGRNPAGRRNRGSASTDSHRHRRTGQSRERPRSRSRQGEQRVSSVSYGRSSPERPVGTKPNMKVRSSFPSESGAPDLKRARRPTVPGATRCRAGLRRRRPRAPG